MAGYIYRDELLQLLTPLLERLDCSPERLDRLTITVHGLEVDKITTDPFAPLDFAFYSIADRTPVPVPSRDRVDEVAIDQAADRLERERSQS